MPEVRRVAARGLQNAFASKEIAAKLVDEALDLLISFLLKEEDIGAGFCLYNLLLYGECARKMIDRKVHTTILKVLCEVSTLPAKSVCLQMLAQFSSDAR